MSSEASQPPMTRSSQIGGRSKYTILGTNPNRSPSLRQPPIAYYQQNLHSSPRASPVLYIPSPRQHGSISSNGTIWSGETASSAASTPRTNRSSSTSPYYMASHVEQGHISPLKPVHRNMSVHQTTRQSMSDTERRTRDHNSAIFRHIQEQEGPLQEDDHAISVLAFLSIVDPFYSAFTAFYSVLIGLIFLICSPICICNKSFSTSNNIVRALAPLLKQHLSLIHADSVNELHSFDLSPYKLVLIHAISPFLSVCVAISSWVAACFWLFALTMGNPDGTERGDDGRATVLNLRDWWEKFLLSAATRR